MLEHAQRQAQRMVDRRHPLRVALRQIVVHRDQVKVEELLKIDTFRNVPTQMVLNQTNHLKEIYKTEYLNGFEYVQLNTTLNSLYDIQGGCERIKTTIFPRLYTYYTTSITWLFSALLILSLVDEFDWQTLVVRAMVAYVFLIVNQLGTHLKNPFENKDSDTPMTALCRTIEIDLRQMLGEKDLPLPLKPEKGVLN